MNYMKPKVAFICVHNSCRSQMAEALGKLFASEVFEAYSAGTELRQEINQDAVRTIKDLYKVDMNKTQRSKLLTDIPEVDIVVKMGCNVVCPFLPSKHEEDWGLEDPSGKSDEEFIKTAKKIEENIRDLAKRIKDNEINYDEEI
jgi:arsenate reductase